MPLYTVITQAGALSGKAKAKLAGELTTLHSEYAGVPKNWVHIVFQDYEPGSGFTRRRRPRRSRFLSELAGRRNTSVSY
jgi:phenylpyruvate tautomerase PptA (4-oxalocrotonate tautomerase family)